MDCRQSRNCGSIPGRGKRFWCSAMALGSAQPGVDLVLGMIPLGGRGVVK